MKHFWDDFTWEDLEIAKKNNAIIVIPIGATEQHGLHLPVGTDTFIAFDLIKEAAAKLKNINLIYTRPVWTGYSPFQMGFNGTITINPELFCKLILSVCISIKKHGFKKIILFNGHGGNTALLNNLVMELRSEHNIRALMFNYWNLAIDYIQKWRESVVGGINHACELETSLMLFKHEELVKKDKYVKCIYSPKTKYIVKDLACSSMVSIQHNMDEVTETGVLGDPALATFDKGEKLYEELLKRLIEFVEDFYTWDIDNPKSF